MAIGWGGFAQGLTAGSSAAARAYQARIDAEEQEFRQSERAREADFRRDIKEGSAAAQTEDQTGYGITDVATGKTTYVPEAAKESGGLQAYASMKDAEGNPLYTIGEAPVRYSEARVQGGKTLGQVVEDPNVATPGGAARGLQADWDKNKMQRLEEIALRHDRPERAAQYGQLTSQKLSQELARGEIDMLPGKKTKQDLEIEEATRKVAMAKLEDSMMAASRSPEAALKFYNDRDPSDGPIEIVPNKKTGKNEFVQTNADGSKTVVGKPYADWDEGRRQILSEIPGFAKTQFEADLKHKSETERDKAKHGYSMEEIAERGKWTLRNTAAVKADKAINWKPGQREEYERIEQGIADAVKKGDYNEVSRLGVQLQVHTNKVLMDNKLPPRNLSVPQRRETTWTDVKAFQDAQKDFIETYRSPEGKGFYSLSPEDQNEVLGKKGLLHGPSTTRGGGSGEQSGQSGQSGVVSGPNAASNRDSGPAGGSKETKPARGRSRPEMPPETNVPAEATSLDAARKDMRAAEAKLQKWGVVERKRDPEGYATAQALVRAAQDQLRTAEAHWEGVAPNAGAVTGLQPRPR